MRRIVFNIIKIIALLVLPFILLVRGSVYLNETYAIGPWVSLGGGIAGTALLLFLYFTFMYGKITGRLGDSDNLMRRSVLSLIIVGAYVVYGLIFISGNNTKTTEVQKEYTELHPILRLGVSTIVFLDKDLIVTDASRVQEDYEKMGLKTKRRSLHYRQKSTGYVHAVDIRTKSRTEVRNFLLKNYFKAMGFNTLRHVGTEDHLHISIASKDAPGAI